MFEYSVQQFVYLLDTVNHKEVILLMRKIANSQTFKKYKLPTAKICTSELQIVEQVDFLLHLAVQHCSIAALSSGLCIVPLPRLTSS